MWGILRNDLYVNQKTNRNRLILVLLWSVVFFIPIKKQSLEEVGVFWNIVYFLAGCITVFLFLFTANASVTQAVQADEKSNWQNYLLASPVAVKKQGWAKYIETFALYGLVCAYALLLFQIVKWNNGITIPKSIVAMAGLFFLFQSVIELPLVFRVGSRYGNYVKLGAVYTILFVILMYLLYGPIDGVLGANQMFNFIAKLANGERSIADWLQAGKVVVPVAILLMYVISGWLSCRIFNAEKTLEK